LWIWQISLTKNYLLPRSFWTRKPKKRKWVDEAWQKRVLDTIYVHISWILKIVQHFIVTNTFDVLFVIHFTYNSRPSKQKISLMRIQKFSDLWLNGYWRIGFGYKTDECRCNIKLAKRYFLYPTSQQGRFLGGGRRGRSPPPWIRIKESIIYEKNISNFLIWIIL
jgi:hypothetical protein